MPERLCDRRPEVPPEKLVEAMVPPPRFDAVRFSTFEPDPREPSQATALQGVEQFAEKVAADGTSGRGLFGRLRRDSKKKQQSDEPSGVYLDGGFGVGKTHLLASLWHVAPEPKAYGTFVELTSLVGALGFQPTIEALSRHRLLAIDEFELDDPGDTVLVSTLLSRLVESGVRLAATSNTQPEDLGEDRFAAEDFLREIQGLASHFEVLRVEGEDYRQRGQPEAPEPMSPEEVSRRVGEADGATCDDFDDLLAYLATLHPSRYGWLVEGVPLVGLTGVHPVDDQAVALRLVVLVDRLYDRNVPVAASGLALSDIFGGELLTGPHRKKYQRALSRLAFLARDAARS